MRYKLVKIANNCWKLYTETKWLFFKDWEYQETIYVETESFSEELSPETIRATLIKTAEDCIKKEIERRNESNRKNGLFASVIYGEL